MDYEILQSVSQGGDGAQDAENSRIAAVADELERLCAINEGRFTNGRYEVWDVVPRNALVDAEGDIFVVDAEIKEIK